MPLRPISADPAAVERGVGARRRPGRRVAAALGRLRGLDRWGGLDRLRGPGRWGGLDRRGGVRRWGALVGLVGLVVPLAACSPAPEPGETGGVAVVTSTNVWGDVVNQVGGSLVSVTAFISSPSGDPHSYEANARNQLALKNAALVVANGGGYDDFVDTMVASLASPPPVLHAFTLAATGEDNEHVWYDLPVVRAVADEVATRLGEIDPANAATFTANAKAFDEQLAGLEQQVADIEQQAAGTPVAITEPVPLYLIEAAGLDNLTPPEFSASIEEETDVPPAVLAETLALFSGHRVRALVYNSQTTGPQTESVLAAAKSAHIAVVPVTETLPAGVGYVEWMQRTVTALREAVVA